MRRTILGLLLAASLVTASIAMGPIAGAAPATNAGETDAGEGEVSATDLALQETNESETNRTDRTPATESGTCDYAGLYEETIHSVVQVQVAGSDVTQQQGGIGSGFVYEPANATNESNAASSNDTNATSHVVTNQHVVSERENVTIEFSDGQSRPGEVVGTDIYSDLAVVEVRETPEDVESLSIAEESPRPGEPVAALGSPFGLEGTITEGIVSAVDRSMPTERNFEIPNTVQTDAPINPGNSGGPLVTCDGDVVGVNRAGGGQNIGFAIGASLLDRVVPALIEDGEYDHPYLGVQTTPVTPELAEANGLETTSGVYVHQVATDGPAADALEESTGVETVDGQRVPVGGDVIVAIDGEEVRNGEELGGYLATGTEPGDEVEVTVIRGGEETTVTVTVGERPPPETR